MVTQEQVLEALMDLEDPEIGMNVVDLGLIYGIVIQGDKVHLEMTMTTPGCPAIGYLLVGAKERIEELAGVSEADVELVWEPLWSPDRMSQEARLALGFL